MRVLYWLGGLLCRWRGHYPDPAAFYIWQLECTYARLLGDREPPQPRCWRCRRPIGPKG